jgi:type IX secretion system PorP/SprF family membrane protein
MNPADAGSNRNCFLAEAFYQRQWYGTDDAPTTQLLSFQAPLPHAAGSGTYIFNDRNGYNTKMGFQQSISVDIILRKNRKGFTSLAFGLSALVEQAALDMSEFSSSDAAVDPAISGGVESGTGFNLNTGLILKINQYKIGASVTNILENNNPFYEGESEPSLPPYFHAFASSVFKYPNRELYIEPVFYYQINTLNDKRLEMNLRLQMPTLSNDLSFWGLIAYRRTMDHDYGKDLGMALTAGVLYKSFNFGIEHQYGLTSAQTNYGSYMKVVLGYRFCTDKSKAAIPCSAAGLSGIGSGELHKPARKGLFRK